MAVRSTSGTTTPKTCYSQYPPHHQQPQGSGGYPQDLKIQHTNDAAQNGHQSRFSSAPRHHQAYDNSEEKSTLWPAPLINVEVMKITYPRIWLLAAMYNNLLYQQLRMSVPTSSDMYAYPPPPLPVQN
ncbi:hypothetical protein CVS40_6048 [Lucilia cuprina]|nr:hypothetical protein CVS40_6048 [Lucilia cuprina]